LGATSVVALDVDPEALEATRENVRRNAVEDIVTVLDLPVGAVDGTFDLVVANIGLATITGLAPALAGRAPSLVLSGFLAGSWEQLLPAFPAFTVTSVLEEDGWLAVELHSRSFVRC
jgi:ribosomal protein L11 methyltransferase